MNHKGICYLIGAGPGDLGLVTLKAKACIEDADIIFYDALANPQILEWARPNAELIDVGKRAKNHTLAQRTIEERLIEETLKHKKVVRLKGGDPFLFGRGAEECQALQKAGCEFEVIPGITAALAASAYTGIPLTHREFASSITFVTGHEDPLKEKDAIEWEALAHSKSTLAIYMGVERLKNIAERLMQAGMAANTPCALIESATTSKQRTLLGELHQLEKIAEQNHLKAPAIILVGAVCAFQNRLNWFEKKPLFGKRIVLTRTRKQSSQLRAHLEKEGAEVIELPTIRINPVEWDLKKMEKPLDWLIFTSPNGVEHFFKRYLQFSDIRKLSEIRIAAVGPSTAEALKSFGIRTDWMPQRFTAQDLATTWPISIEKKHEKKETVLFVCGNLAKQDVETILKQKSIQVERLEVYTTQPEMVDRTGLRKRLIEESVDWIVFASSSAIENFHALNLKLSANCRYASFGPITSQAMRALGYSVDYESQTSQVEAFVEGLVQLYLK